VAAAALSLGFSTPVRADGAVTTGGFWQISKEAGKVELVIPGQAAPVATAVTDSTLIAGVCLDCMLPLEFKTTQAGKNCSVCGCSVSNAACIVGKPVKDGTWQSMLKALPHGVGLLPVYVEAGKPESGLKRLTVNLRAVVLPVSGLDGQSADQLLNIVKAIGGTKAELLDSGKILSVTLKTDYTADKAAKLEKAIAAANGKITVPEAAAPAN
jgi:hypothetical protein